MQKIKIIGKHYREMRKGDQYILFIRDKGSEHPPKNLIPTNEELIFAAMVNEKQHRKLRSKKYTYSFEGELLKYNLDEEADFSFVCYHVNIRKDDNKMEIGEESCSSMEDTEIID